MNFDTSKLAAYWQQWKQFSNPPTSSLGRFCLALEVGGEKHPGDEVVNPRMQESLSDNKNPSLYILPYLQRMIAMVSHRELQFWQF